VKRLVLGLGLIVVLTACSSNPATPSPTVAAPTPTVTPAPTILATATPSAIVAVPDLCQLLTASEAAEIMGVDDSITVPSDVAEANDASSDFVNGVRIYSTCEQDGWENNLPIDEVTAECTSLVGSVDPSYLPDWLQNRMTYLISNGAPDVEPITDVGSQAILSKEDSPPPSGAEVDFIVGSGTSCSLSSESNIRDGDALATSLVAFATQVAQLIHP
jgi:hypothetical protein